MDKTIIGKNIDEIRKMKGLTMKDLGDMVGIRDYTVSSNLSTGNMPLDSLFKYAEVLGVKPYDLLVDASEVCGYEIRFNITSLYPQNFVYEAYLKNSSYYGLDESEKEKEALLRLYEVHIPSLLNVISSEFTKREQEVIEMRWKHHMTLKAIADHYGLTHERIRQIEKKVLRKILSRKRMNEFMMVTPEVLEEYRKKIPKRYVRIDELELSTRVFNTLKRYGYNYIDELVDVPVMNLLHIRNMGEKGLDELLIKLESYGIGVEERENGELFTASIMTH